MIDDYLIKQMVNRWDNVWWFLFWYDASSLTLWFFITFFVHVSLAYVTNPVGALQEFFPQFITYMP